MTGEVFTCGELAKRWKCKRDAVAAKIAAGNLAAFDLNSDGKRRVWRISAEAVASYEQAHAARPQQPKPRRRRRKRAGDVHEFF